MAFILLFFVKKKHLSNNSEETLDYDKTKQNSVPTYIDIFLYLGLLFLICIPFIQLVKEVIPMLK